MIGPFKFRKREKSDSEGSEAHSVSLPQAKEAPKAPLVALDTESHFVFKDGRRVKDLRELVSALKGINEVIFRQHVTPHKNDFATWINDTIKDSELAHALGPIKDKQQMVAIITARNDATKKKASVTHAPLPAERPSTKIQSGTKVEQGQSIYDVIKQGFALIEKKKYAEAKKIYQKIIKLYKELPSEMKKKVFAEAGRLHQSLGQQQRMPATPRSQPEKKGGVKIVPKAGEGPVQRSAREGAQKVRQKSTQKPEQKIGEGGKQKPKYDVDLKTMSVKEILVKLNLMDPAGKFIAVQEEGVTRKAKRRGLRTGVPGFDEMIPDGIPQGSAILVSGGPGSGKTTFCIQMLGWAAEQGEKCLFMTFEESDEHLIDHMESYGLNPRKYIEQGNLMIQKMDPIKISRIIEALLAHGRGELVIDINEILDIMPEGFKPDRVVIDSLSSVASAFSESDTAYRIYINQLINILERTGATSFLISEVQGVEKIGHGLVEEFLTDGVIVFYNLQKGNIKQNAIEILKIRAADHAKKIVPFEFVKDKGIVVYPLEKIFI